MELPEWMRLKGLEKKWEVWYDEGCDEWCGEPEWDENWCSFNYGFDYFLTVQNPETGGTAAIEYFDEGKASASDGRNGLFLENVESEQDDQFHVIHSEGMDEEELDAIKRTVEDDIGEVMLEIAQ